MEENWKIFQRNNFNQIEDTRNVNWTKYSSFGGRNPYSKITKKLSNLSPNKPSTKSQAVSEQNLGPIHVF
jgi:hypothetical protein